MVRADILSAELIAYYRHHPLEFIENAILAPKRKIDEEDYQLSDQQKELIESIWFNKRTACRSGKGIGKTTSIALAAITFCTLYPKAKVVITAPSKSTLKTATLPEIKLWLEGSYLEDLYSTTAEKITLKEDKSGNSFIETRTASKESPESLQGIHANFMLLLVDESSNVPDECIRAFLNTLTAKKSFHKNHIAMISNPTRNIGEFYSAMMEDGLNLWKKLHYSALESPLTSKEQHEDSKLKYGESSNIYRCDVLGEFPTTNDDAFIGLSAVAAAMARDVEPSGDIHIGIDPARFGTDSSVWIWRQGNKVYEPIFEGKTSIPELVEISEKLVYEIRAMTGFQNCIKVKVDANGLGAGVYDYLKLKEKELNIEVISCNFGGGGNERYADEASMMWGQLHDMINDLDLPDEHNAKNPHAVKYLREEIAVRRASYDTGKIKIENKSVFKKEYGRSPDFADALVLCTFDKRSERSAVRNFNPTDNSNLVKNGAYLASDDIYVSVYYSRDRLVSVIVGKWGNGKLTITHERIDDSSISNLAFYLKHFNAVKIVGNDKCFGKRTRDDVRGQLRKFGVTIRQNISYDEIGALELINQMHASRRLRFSEKCPTVLQQMYNWRLDKNDYELETEYGLCYALLNLVSELKRKIKKSELPEPEIPDYGQADESETNYQMLHKMHVRSMM